MSLNDLILSRYRYLACILIWIHLKLCPVVQTGRTLDQENELLKNRTHFRHKLHHRLSMYPHLAHSMSNHYGYGSLYDWSTRCIER